MTCTDFYMDVKTLIVYIDCKDGDMRMSTEVLVDDFVDALLHSNSNLEYIAEPVKDELKKRANNAWDDGMITDTDLGSFKKVLERIL